MDCLDAAETTQHNPFHNRNHPREFTSDLVDRGEPIPPMPDRTQPPLNFHDLAVGDAWTSPARTVTEADIAHFAGLSGDYNPLHVDAEAARAGPFGGPVAHGLLVLSISTGLSAHAPRVDTLAFLEMVSWRFLNPVKPGDTIRVLTAVEALEPRSRDRRGVVTWSRRIVNQAGTVVQEGTTRTLVRGRPTPAN